MRTPSALFSVSHSIGASNLAPRMGPEPHELGMTLAAVNSLSQRASEEESSPQYPSAATDSSPLFEED